MYDNPANTSTADAQPTVIRLMKERGITQIGIAHQLSKDLGTVKRALNPATFATVTYQHLYPIRNRIQHLLIASGWKGNPDDLWAEYDRRLAA